MTNKTPNLFVGASLCLLLLCGTVATRAQSAADLKKIKAGYSKDLKRSGKDSAYFATERKKLESQLKEATERVKKYLKEHPGQKRIYKLNGQEFFIQDIRPDGTPIIITTKDRECGDVIKSNSMYNNGSLGLNVTGTNMVAGVWDGGKARITHELFQNRALLKDNAATLSNHMCHVAGDLMGGDITANPAARGIAYNATAWCYDWDNDGLEFSQFGSDGYLVSNHSYGRGNTSEPIWSFGAYDLAAKNLDGILATRLNYLQVWAGGNEQGNNNNRPQTDANGQSKSGYDVMTGTSVSKNILCVGALKADGGMSDFSNWGPTDDGRIKPDICAKGVSMTSAYSASDNIYNTGNGTSYAAPSISGLALLLQQHYRSLNSEYLEAAGLRGLLMHTSTDLGRSGPDYQFGWGMANGEKAAQTIMVANADFSQNNSESKITKIGTNPPAGSSVTYTVKAKGGQPLMVSIGWTDDQGAEQLEPDGIDPITGRLVYNFDLKVTAPGGTTVFYPWSGPGMLNRTQNATRTGANNVDNFERVDIDNPVADGVYTITITKAAGSPASLRQYTLIATGLRNTSPDVNFNAPAIALAEATTNTIATCVNYSDYNLTMTVAAAPSANANVQIAIDPITTAVEGKNFDVTTNGMFGTGSSKTLVFPGGSTAPQSYTVRVYDDAVFVSDKQIILSFTTSGGGTSVGKSAAKTTITINDNDGTRIATAGSTIGTTSEQTGPFSNNNADLLMDHYFTAAELTAAGLVANSTITGLTLNVATKQSTTPFPNFKIRMAHVNATPTASSAFLTAGSFTDCYANTSYSTVGGSNVFNFPTPFVWNGTENVVVRYCYDGTADRGSTDFDVFTAKTDVLGTGVNSVVYNYEPASANANGCNLPVSSYIQSSKRPVTQFIFTKAGTAAIETAAGGSRTENLNSSNGTYRFYSAGNRLIANLQEPTQNSGCTEAKIEAAGNGFVPMMGGEQSNKVWKITPSTNAGTNSYTVTLYMTGAELAGQNTIGLKIFKSSAPDAASMNSSNTTSANTTITTFPGYVAFSAPFSGFSLFRIGTSSVILPISWVSISATKNALNQAVVKWTVEEQKVARYEVQKSTDGRTFVGIGSVSSKGNGKNTYNFTETQTINSLTYYRVIQHENNGNIIYSQVLKLNSASTGILVSMYPNPAKDITTLQVETNKPGLLPYHIVDATGRIVRQGSFTLAAGTNILMLSLMNLPGGVYAFRSANDAQPINLRFIKE